ncbi:hypothetical protein [Rhizobium laguerreae]|uniref:hypothetical protein n=1 Tax=Rhizobium laguerreae TaxID=1076926 RepID=UPI001C908149|nr:hypothetical protein [Rhizobium laguerreae]MBY3206876.1 hypothetical protein [Rhizobium laguerreae]
MAILLRVLLIVSFSLISGQSVAQQPAREDQQKTCDAILGGKPVAKECTKAFAKDAGCCIQYDAKRLASRCEKMSTIEYALTCFSEIHEVGFWKTDLIPENEPGLGAQYAEQWKRNVMRVCSAEKSKKAALDCAILQKGGTKVVYDEKNAEVARKAVSEDPIFKFCRNAFGDYWEGIEDCVKKQHAAKRRLGQ